MVGQSILLEDHSTSDTDIEEEEPNHDPPESTTCINITEQTVMAAVDNDTFQQAAAYSKAIIQGSVFRGKDKVQLQVRKHSNI